MVWLSYTWLPLSLLATVNQVWSTCHTEVPFPAKSKDVLIPWIPSPHPVYDLYARKKKKKWWKLRLTPNSILPYLNLSDTETVDFLLAYDYWHCYYILSWTSLLHGGGIIIKAPKLNTLIQYWFSHSWTMCEVICCLVCKRLLFNKILCLTVDVFGCFQLLELCLHLLTCPVVLSTRSAIHATY